MLALELPLLQLYRNWRNFSLVCHQWKLVTELESIWKVIIPKEREVHQTLVSRNLEMNRQNFIGVFSELAFLTRDLAENLLNKHSSIRTNLFHRYGSAPCQIYVKKGDQRSKTQKYLEEAEIKTGNSLPLTWRCFLTKISRFEVTSIPCYDQREHCGCSSDPWPTELEIVDFEYRFILTPPHVVGLVSQILIQGLEEELLVSKFETPHELVEITWNKNYHNFQVRKQDQRNREYVKRKHILDSDSQSVVSFLDLITSNIFWSTMHLGVEFIDFILQAKQMAEEKWMRKLLEKNKKIQPTKMKKITPKNIFCILEEVEL